MDVAAWRWQRVAARDGAVFEELEVPKISLFPRAVAEHHRVGTGAHPMSNSNNAVPGRECVAKFRRRREGRTNGPLLAVEHLHVGDSIHVAR